MEEYTCYDLADLRPPVPVAAGAPSTPGPTTTVPALTAGRLRVGACYDFNALQNSGGLGRASAYVPAILLRKQVVSSDDMSALPARLGDRSDAAGQAGDGAPGSRIEAVLKRLERAAEVAAVGDGGAGPAGVELEITIFCPGEDLGRSWGWGVGSSWRARTRQH